MPAGRSATRAASAGSQWRNAKKRRPPHLSVLRALTSTVANSAYPRAARLRERCAPCYILKLEDALVAEVRMKVRQLCTQAGRMGLGAPGSGVEGRWGRGLDRPRALRGGSRRRRADGWLAGPGRTPAHLLERGPCRFRSLPARMAACLCQGPAVPVGRHPPRPARWRRVAGGAPRRSASAALHRSPRRLEARPVATPPSRLRGRVRHLRPGSAPGTRLPRLSRGSDP